MTLRSNPRILVLVGVIVALVALTVIGFVFLTALYGVILLAIALFLSYQFIRFAVSHIRSYLKTDEEGVTFHMPSNDDERFDWEEISHAGYCTPQKGRDFAFVYSQVRDRLITIPREYEHFEELLAEMQHRLEFTRFNLDPGVTIQAKLREILGLPDPAQDDSADQAEEAEDDDDEEEASAAADEERDAGRQQMD
jgi:hypothetical protein